MLAESVSFLGYEMHALTAKSIYLLHLQAKRRRRKAGKVDTASKLAEGTGQPRCDAEAAASESATLEVEDEELTYSQPSKPCVSAGMYIYFVLVSSLVCKYPTVVFLGCQHRHK